MAAVEISIAAFFVLAQYLFRDRKKLKKVRISFFAFDKNLL
jgi:uncharacterized membrane protein (DUF106 family)